MTEKISAAESIAAVLAKVKSVGKNSKNQQQGFNYRGIDAVVNAVHPVLAEVGGFIVGEVLEQDVDSFTSAKGAAGTWVRLKVKYSWHGTDGGAPVSGVVCSEANDFADKATAKAWSVALRTFLLQTLLLPTDDPDPDQSYIEGAAPAKRRNAQDTVAAAVTAIQGAADAEALDKLEQLARQRGIDGVAQVRAALDAKRAELGPSTTDHWATAEVPS